LFQKGTILGLQGKYEEKIQTLEKIASKYPTSTYNDDAQYNIGDAYVALNKMQTATTTFNNLIQKYPTSPFVSKSYLKLGLIYYNQDNLKKSVESYKTVIDKFSQSNDAKEALVALKEMSIAEGDPDIYMNVISSRKDLHISVSEQDSISFLSAETRFAKGQCEEAVKKFDDYLSRFPSGYFLLQAYFYRSECLFKLKNYAESVKGYEYVSNVGMNMFREKALAKASELNYYELKNYANAEKYYLMLLENASGSDNIFIANLGLMRCAYHLDKLSQANTYAEKILGSNQSTPEQITEANFYLAKYNQQQKSNGTALIHYKKVAAKTTNVMGAEAQYQIARIHFEENKLKESEDESFKVIDNFSSYDYWYIKAYMLIADIYEKQGNLFQAKATLQSVIENAEDEKLKNEALDKLNKIYAKETNTSNLVPDGMNIDAPLDTIQIR
jgi:tol-pal system protein YbgF